MSAGPKYEYHWADGHTVKKPIKCSAPKYIDYLMTWVQDQLDDEMLFPSKIGKHYYFVISLFCINNKLSSFLKGIAFPSNFMQCAKTILKRLFRVYAHIYHEHFAQVVELSEEAHLNTSFKHFIFFVQEFNLIDKRELAPLQELIETLTERDYQNYPSNNNLTKQEQLEQLEQLQVINQQQINQLNQQINQQLNQQQQINNNNQQQIKCQINVPANNRDQLSESISSNTNSLNSVITKSLNDEVTKQENNNLQYSNSNSRASSSSGNSNKIENVNNAYF